MSSSSQKRTPDLGIGYKAAYTDKDGNEKGFIKLLIRAEQLQGIQPDEKGMIKLTVFPTDNKKRETDPDMVVKPSLSKAKPATSTGAVASQGVSNARAKGSNFPF